MLNEFSRTELLLGRTGMERLAAARVAVFGIGGVHQAYRTGRGRVLMRARTHLEEFGNGRTRIVVDEIPYMVNKRVMYERMHELWR